MVADWLPNKSVLSGYQWKKSLEDDKEIVHWRFNYAGQTQFKVSFTTYLYDNASLLKHISQLDMYYEQLLTEWGANGIGSEGIRFIGLISKSDRKWTKKQMFMKFVTKRNEKLSSNIDLYAK